MKLFFSFKLLSCLALLTLSSYYTAKAESSTNGNNAANRTGPSQTQEQSSEATTTEGNKCNIKLNKITGQIYTLQHDDTTTLRMSLMNTKILVNYGQYVAYPKDDGSFEVDNVPSDSYIVEVTHPKFIYEPARVDITSKGRIRARRVNYIQPALVQTIDYPLVFRPKGLHSYFIPRETWRIMDLLFNPMIIMMVVPLIIIWILPKMMNPQEAQTQREQMQMPEYNVPELSEMMASMFGQGQGGQNPSGAGGSGGGAPGNQAITSGKEGNRHGKAKRR